MLAPVHQRTISFQNTPRDGLRRSSSIHFPVAHYKLPIQPTASTQTNTSAPLLLTLPIELLLQIFSLLDQPTLESLRRTSSIFLRLLPVLYPTLFTCALQGSHPWPVRRLWTLSKTQRRDLLSLVEEGSALAPSAGVLLGGGDAKVGACTGGKLGLKRAWRYLLCPECRVVHPPLRQGLCAGSSRL